MDGAEMPLRVVETTPSPRHHINATVKLVLEDISPGSHQLVIQDLSFKEADGAIRMAFKCRGGAILKSSNVEPTLVRSERIELGKIRRDARSKYTRLNSSFIVPGK